MNIELGKLGSAPARRFGRQTIDGPISKEPLRLKLYLAMIVLDSLAMVIGFGIGNFLRFNDFLHVQGINMCLVLLPVYLGVALNSRAYNMDVLVSSRLGILRALSSLLFAVAATTFIAFYLRAGMDFSRIVFTCGVVATAILIIPARRVLGRYANQRCGHSPLSELVLKDGLDCPVTPGAYVIDARALGLRPDIADPLMLDRLGRLLKNADRVVVACLPETRARWAMALKGANISGELVDEQLDELGAIGTSHYAGRSTMLVSAGPLGLRDRVIKRLLDVSLAGTALMMLAPMMAAVAVAIKLESRGPVFLRSGSVGPRQSAVQDVQVPQHADRAR